MTIIRRNLLIGFVSVALGCILILLREIIPSAIIISCILIPPGIIFISFSLAQYKGWIEKPNLDERIYKIRAYAFMNAFGFTFCIVCILFLLDFTNLLRLSSRQILEILFYTMGLSAAVLLWSYNRQGDISE